MAVRSRSRNNGAMSRAKPGVLTWVDILLLLTQLNTTTIHVPLSHSPGEAMTRPANGLREIAAQRPELVNFVKQCRWPQVDCQDARTAHDCMAATGVFAAGRSGPV